MQFKLRHGQSLLQIQFVISEQQQSLNLLFHFVHDFAPKGLRVSAFITAACFQEGKKKNQGNRLTEAFHREEIWQVIAFQEHVIKKNNHLPFTLFIVFCSAGLEAPGLLSGLPWKQGLVLTL